MKEILIKNISIGDELLIGQVVNTNAAWLGEQLSNAGFRLDSTLTIGDSEQAILQAFNACMDADLVLVTGGLGPTADDITKPTVCKFFGTELAFCEAAYDNVVALLQRRGFPMSERNRGQAMLPQSCVYIPNTYGTAPCMWLEKEGVVFAFMPGVPFEMKGIFTDELLPRIRQRFRAVPYEKRVIMTTGIGESFLADKIKDWEEALPGFLSLAYLPQHGMVRLRLSGRHEDAALLHATLDEQVDKLTRLIHEYIFAMQDQPIERTVFDLLKQKGQTFASAESCTGGNIAHAITLIPGSSEVFKGAAVTYATASKTKVLGVPEETIEQHGVVSQQVVERMAIGVRSLMEADYGVATTGVAGPSGGTDDNPVGTVWIGVALPTGVVSKRFNFGKDRENVINRATIAAYELLRKSLALLVLVFALASCQPDEPAYKAQLDIDVQPYDLEFSRYEEVLFNLDTANFQAELMRVQEPYRVFLSGDLNNLEAVDYLKAFATDPFNVTLYHKAQEAFPDLRQVEPMVEDVFAHFHHYYPDIQLPTKAFTCITGIHPDEPSVQIIDNQLVISLDWYLGDLSVYDQIGMPRYMSLRRHKATLAKDVAEQLYMNYLYEWRKQGQVVGEMVFYGRRNYFVEALCPSLPDSVLLGYGTRQWQWAVDNEGQVWADIVGNRRLYDAGLDSYMMFFGDGPFTQAYSNDAPSRLGEFFGLNIVRAYVSNNETTLRELMSRKDLQSIFQDSGYKPKK